jgi:hypothetical protein
MFRILMAIALLYAASPFVSAQDKKPTLADLGWLSGSWDNGDTLRRYEEQWMKPGGTSMLGMSRTVGKGRTVAHEFLQIKQDTTGEIFYVANPSGQSQAAFKLVKFGTGELVFENPEHDFPQRIVYRLNGDTLVARIEGVNKGKQRGVDFPMMKVKCE